MSLPSVSVDRVFENAGQMHYLVNKVAHHLPSNFSGKNASAEMREGFVKYLNLANTRIFLSYPPELREKVFKERIYKVLKETPGDPVIDRMFLIIQAGFFVIVIIGLKNTMARL